MLSLRGQPLLGLAEGGVHLQPEAIDDPERKDVQQFGRLFGPKIPTGRNAEDGVVEGGRSLGVLVADDDVVVL
jgi:hypothetical protein